MRNLKKLTLFAASALMLASCSNDDLWPAGKGEPIDVSFSVGIPAEIQTRAGELTGKGYAIEDLYITAMPANSSVDPVTIKYEGAFHGNTDRADNIVFNLVSGETYRLVFWADCGSGCGYEYADGKVNISNTSLKANDEKRDAFYTVEDAFVAGTSSTEIHLRRATAQINIGCTEQDTADATALGVTVTDAGMELAYEAYPTLDLLTGLFEGTPQEYTMTAPLDLAKNGRPADSKITAAGTDYDYLATAYVICGDEGLVLNNVAFKFDSSAVARNYSNIPLKRNYRTNIVGQILTNPTNFSVILEQSFEDSEDFVDGIHVKMPQGVTVQDFLDNNAKAYVESMSATRVETTNFFRASFTDALDLASTMTEGATIYLLPGTELTRDKRDHPGTKCPNLVVYANGATFKGFDFGIDSNDDSYLTGDQNIEIHDARNLYVWGQSHSNVTRNITMINCVNEGVSPTEDAGRMFYLTKAVGTTNVTLDGCVVKNCDSPVYMNCSGSMTIRRCRFVECAVPINVNYKATSGSQNDIVENCTFINCGSTDSSIGQYAAPIRFVSTGSADAALNLTVRGNVVRGTKGINGDVLLVEYRKGMNTYPVNVIEMQSDLDVVNFCAMTSARELKLFRDLVNGGNNFAGFTFGLGGDIDLNNELWTPIGWGKSSSDFKPFKGTFNGNGHTIRNLKLRKIAGYRHYGLFGWITQGAVLKNFTVENADIDVAYEKEADVVDGAGAVLGYAFNSGSVEHVTVKNVTIKANHYAGGVAGRAYCHFEGCKAYKVNIELTPNLNSKSKWDNGDKAGGIIGQSLDSGPFRINNCVVDDLVITGYRDMGGIAGMHYNSGSVTNNTVKNATITQKKFNFTDAQNTIETFVGRRANDTPVGGGNTSENVTISKATF